MHSHKKTSLEREEEKRVAHNIQIDEQRSVRGAEGGDDSDAARKSLAVPDESDTELGDTDQHSAS
jgi:hypothetical protein